MEQQHESDLVKRLEQLGIEVDVSPTVTTRTYLQMEGKIGRFGQSFLPIYRGQTFLPNLTKIKFFCISLFKF